MENDYILVNDIDPYRKGKEKPVSPIYWTPAKLNVLIALSWIKER